MRKGTSWRREPKQIKSFHQKMLKAHLDGRDVMCALGRAYDSGWMGINPAYMRDRPVHQPASTPKLGEGWGPPPTTPVRTIGGKTDATSWIFANRRHLKACKELIQSTPGAGQAELKRWLSVRVTNPDAVFPLIEGILTKSVDEILQQFY